MNRLMRQKLEAQRDAILRLPTLTDKERYQLQALNDALRTESPEERRYLDILRRAAEQRERVLVLRSRIEALPDLVLGSGRVIVGAVDRGAVLALLDEVSR